MDISVFFYYRYVTLPPEIEMLRASCISFLKSPLLYLYMFSLIYTDFKLRLKHLIHGLPFLLSIVVLSPGFFLTDSATQHSFLEHFNQMPEIILLHTAGDLQAWGYIIANVLLLRRYRTLLLENYASNISLSNYKWLYQLTCVIIMLIIITQAKGLLLQTEYTDIANVLTVVMLIGGLGFIFWIVLNALYSPDLFRGIDARLQPVEKLIVEASTEQVSGLRETTEEANESILKIKEYMIQEEPYLAPSLTVQDLANQMGIPARDLSILINHHLDQHFFDFINEHRIEKAMQLLKDPRKKEFTILEILYEVGFNSKSSFNTAFKKHTDLTPTQYRKVHLA